MIKNANSWNSAIGISFFDIADSNKDDRITEAEVLTNPNKAVVKEWVALVETLPRYVKSKGITRREFDDLSRHQSNQDGKSSVRYKYLAYG